MIGQYVNVGTSGTFTINIYVHCMTLYICVHLLVDTV